jgi:alkaline phosphatase D
VEATNLTASTIYSYQFENCADPSNKSPLGKTRTAPGKYAKNVPTQNFAIYSCSNYPKYVRPLSPDPDEKQHLILIHIFSGFFSAYSGPVIHNDADYVVHLGDYIYEYGTGGSSIGRIPSKASELATLDDYRQRYAQYRTDPDLSTMHQNLPIIAIWDDHETANNDFKAGSSDSNDSISTGGCAYSNNTICFSDRAVNAKRAYFEWIPIRQVDLSDQGKIWRDFRFGDLLDIYALDTRKYDRDITDLSYNVDYVQELAKDMDSQRSIMGPVQEQWIEDGLSASQERGTVWKLIWNQVILGS